MDRIAAGLGTSRLAAAHGIHRVVNTNMAEGVRLVSVRRGVDPRQFALLAFGGASGLHAQRHPRPPTRPDAGRSCQGSLLCLLASGMLTTDLRFEVARTHIGHTRALDGAAIKRLFYEMEAEGLTRLGASFDGPTRATRSVNMRYGEQVFEIAVPLDDVDWTMPDPLAQIVERFHRRHEELYTYSSPDQDTVLVNARVGVAGILSALPQEPCLPEAELARPRCQRRIWLDEWIAAAVWDFDALAPGQVVKGPAIIESAMTTVLLCPAIAPR